MYASVLIKHVKSIRLNGYFYLLGLATTKFNINLQERYRISFGCFMCHIKITT